MLQTYMKWLSLMSSSPWSDTQPPAGFVYIGVFVTPKFKQMYKANFVPLFEKVRQDLDRWNSLPVSWLGCISLVKMNVLPRLLYPIQMIPVIFSNRVIKDLTGWLSGGFCYGQCGQPPGAQSTRGRTSVLKKKKSPVL